MSRNNSPDRTVRLNTALNTALIKKRIKSDTQDKCNSDTQQTQTNTNTMEHNQAELINEEHRAIIPTHCSVSGSLFHDWNKLWDQEYEVKFLAQYAEPPQN